MAGGYAHSGRDDLQFYGAQSNLLGKYFYRAENVGKRIVARQKIRHDKDEAKLRRQQLLCKTVEKRWTQVSVEHPELCTWTCLQSVHAH